MAGAAPLEAVHPDLRHAGRSALVEPDRHVEVLGGGPERLVHRVVDHLGAVIRVRPDEGALHPELLAREAHLGDRQIDILHRQHRDAEQPVRVRLAVIGEPAVIGAAYRGGELRVVDRAREQAEARIQERGVDAVRIHVGDARVRVEPAGLAFLVFHRVGGDDALARADRADPADAELRVADRVLLDDQPLLAALVVLDDARRPVAELGIDVFVPEIERLQDMPVGIDDVVGAGHQGSSPAFATDAAS